VNFQDFKEVCRLKMMKPQYYVSDICSHVLKKATKLFDLQTLS